MAQLSVACVSASRTAVPGTSCRYLWGMRSPDAVSTLCDEDQLSLWVGRVARIHVLLEYNLTNVYGALGPPGSDGLGGTGPAVGADRLADECRKLLRKADLSHQIVEAGTQALKAAKHANTLRNRIIHDMWLPDSSTGEGQPPRWYAFRQSRGRMEPIVYPSPRDLEAVESAYTSLARTRLRVSGLFMALHAVLPQYRDSSRPASARSELPRYIALMADRFTLAPNGDFEITHAE